MNYFELIKLSVKRPNYFAKFFVINLFLGLLLKAVFDAVFRMRMELFFLGISQIIFIGTVYIIFTLIFTSVLFLLSWVLKGKGKFKDCLKIYYYCSSPVLLIWIPYVWIPATIWMIYLLVRTFKVVHKYSLISAVVNVVTPFIILGLIVSGLLAI